MKKSNQLNINPLEVCSSHIDVAKAMASIENMAQIMPRPHCFHNGVPVYIIDVGRTNQGVMTATQNLK